MPKIDQVYSDNQDFGSRKSRNQELRLYSSLEVDRSYLPYKDF